MINKSKVYLRKRNRDNIYIHTHTHTHIERCNIDVHRTKYTECAERKYSESSAWGQVLALIWGVGLPRFPELTASDPDFNMQSLTKAFRFDDGKGRGGSCSSE